MMRLLAARAPRQRCLAIASALLGASCGIGARTHEPEPASSPLPTTKMSPPVAAPLRCPPRAAGVPDTPPVVERSVVGGVPLALWRCPGDVPPGDVVHLQVGATVAVRVIDDDNWVSQGVVRQELVELASSSVDVVGPASGGGWAVLVRTRDCCWGTGSLSAYVVDASGVSLVRSFPGGGRVDLREGLFVGVDGPLNRDVQSQVAELDAVVEWRDGLWADAAPELRINHNQWPCDDLVVPRLAIDGVRVGDFRLTRGAPIEVLEYRLTADGTPMYRMRIGEAEGWTEGIEQGCLG